MSTSGARPRCDTVTFTAGSRRPRLASRSTSPRRSGTRGGSSSTSLRCRTAKTSRKERSARRTRSGSRSRAAATSSRRTAVGPRAVRGPRSTPPSPRTGPTPPLPSTPVSSRRRCTASTEPYGYAYGGSGGGYRTIGGAENTTGVWDGVVPYVIGSPMAIPNMFTVRMHAQRVLRHSFDRIVDAVEPGGSGDMFEGLDEEERDALARSDADGLPAALVVRPPHDGDARLPGPATGASSWPTRRTSRTSGREPGYLGHAPPPSLQRDIVQHRCEVVAHDHRPRGGRARSGCGPAAGPVAGRGRYRLARCRRSRRPSRSRSVCRPVQESTSWAPS